MTDDRQPPAGQPLPHFAPEPGQTRTLGSRRVRRISNWTAAALVVGTGATALALAHNAVPVATPLAPATAGTTSAGGPGVSSAANAPHAPHSVATTSASGVTTTTTTQVVNGKTVVTHVRHVPAYHDD